MKRLWISLVIFLCLCTACFWGMRTTTNVTRSLETTLTAAQNAFHEGNKQEAERLSLEAVTYWQKHYNTLCMYIPHIRLEQIDQLLISMPQLIQESEEGQFPSECARAIRQMEYLSDSEKPYLENIL